MALEQLAGRPPSGTLDGLADAMQTILAPLGEGPGAVSLVLVRLLRRLDDPPVSVLPLRASLSHPSAEWETPPGLFHLLDEEFGFTLDVCARPDKAKCPRYFSPEQDGLRQVWTGVCWMNPPCGRRITEWVRKADESARAGATVVCLLPARTDTAWWHHHVARAAEVRFLEGRLNCVRGRGSAPFPPTIVVFRPGRPEGPAPAMTWVEAPGACGGRSTYHAAKEVARWCA